MNGVAATATGAGVGTGVGGGAVAGMGAGAVADIICGDGMGMGTGTSGWSGSASGWTTPDVGCFVVVGSCTTGTKIQVVCTGVVVGSVVVNGMLPHAIPWFPQHHFRLASLHVFVL